MERLTHETYTIRHDDTLVVSALGETVRLSFCASSLDGCEVTLRIPADPAHLEPLKRFLRLFEEACEERARARVCEELR